MKVFISCVSKEFGGVRDELRQRLTGPADEVKVQADFHTGGGAMLRTASPSPSPPLTPRAIRAHRPEPFLVACPDAPAPIPEDHRKPAARFGPHGGPDCPAGG